MFQLFESVKIENGHVFAWDLHWNRMQHSARILWQDELRFPSLHADLLQFNAKGLFKCKIKYSQKNYSLEIHPYQKRKLKHLHIVEDNEIDYRLKFYNRTCFEKHTKTLSSHADILIVKDNLLTDTSYSNIVLWNGTEWHTPKWPLLCGTRREALLQKHLLVEKDITLRDLKFYTKISLINAMLDIGELELDIKQQIILP
ncbi:MAG: aminotransferase class IV [Bacteroidetes bacterium]|nr:aminotransferase class IV [Bacteroidota bacterium]